VNLATTYPAPGLERVAWLDELAALTGVDPAVALDDLAASPWQLDPAGPVAPTLAAALGVVEVAERRRRREMRRRG
jgi:hypothetical protein